MGNWTYYPTQLATSAKDQVRFLVGDTLSTDPQLQDEEINWAISQRGSVLGAAADCCRAIAAKFSRSVDQAAGQARVMFSQMQKAYTAKALEFEGKAAMAGTGMPYAGGISVIDKINNQLDTDAVNPGFQVGMDENLLPVPPAGNESLVQSANVSALGGPE